MPARIGSWAERSNVPLSPSTALIDADKDEIEAGPEVIGQRLRGMGILDHAGRNRSERIPRTL
jgi:hypothetical protein